MWPNMTTSTVSAYNYYYFYDNYYSSLYSHYDNSNIIGLIHAKFWSEIFMVSARQK